MMSWPQNQYQYRNSHTLIDFKQSQQGYREMRNYLFFAMDLLTIFNPSLLLLNFAVKAVTCSYYAAKSYHHANHQDMASQLIRNDATFNIALTLASLSSLVLASSTPMSGILQFAMHYIIMSVCNETCESKQAASEQYLVKSV